jgi:hypothetical protein
MANIYTTVQVSEQLGCSAEAIRSQKSRKSSSFVEGEHYIKQGQSTLWTDQGVHQLRSLIKQDIAAEFSVPAISENLLTPVAAPAVSEDAMQALQPFADAIAIQVIRQHLPGAVRASIRRMLTSPDDQDRVRMQQILESLGLVIAAATLNEALQFAIAPHRNTV